MLLLLSFLLGYGLGAIPFGLLLTRAAGLGDIRAIGSGNIGATNVLRTGYKGLAAATLLLDGLKAVVAVMLARQWLGDEAAPLAAVSAVLGHVFPVWLRFRGGKGVASGLGALLALAWPVGAAACVIWLLMAAVFRISSLSALTALAMAPLIGFWLRGAESGFAALLIALIIMIRHHANIHRLLNGTEPRIGKGK